ncbi:MAG: CO dehydrogenase/CO-methylating acetyl-CoA synthase complex subunit beta [Deltaproteobacteria bacterium]|nr:CO dehydrogenase/CO-methylating acetyl-CoA synthase complex subunit beta [Deltaproteobacteria bacterium]MBL7104969.1 CO dehydrogenase/CO-methylating acetyl-CoA synthase complex subunit beta [Bacteroidales bacterium]
MSKIICDNAIAGAIKFVATAEKKLEEAIKAKGESHVVKLPETAYYLPVIYTFTGIKIDTLGDIKCIIKKAKELLPERPSCDVWLPYLGNTLDAGVATLFATEIIEACKYVIGPNPVNGIWLGAANDSIMRERGIEFVDGTAPGFAAITGAAPTNEIAVKIAKELQQKNLYVFMGGGTNGKQFAEQLAEEGIQLGWETRLIPFGEDVSSLIYALGFANRAALSFGGVEPGDFKANLNYNKDRIFAFVLVFGEVDAEKYAAAAGAINYGFPVISDSDIPQILPTGICAYEHVISNVPHETIVEKALEVRGCKIKITKVPIPVPYGPAFGGERIRKADVQVEFGGNLTTGFEYVTTVDLEDINDGEIEIIGRDFDSIEPGTALPLGIWVEVAGRKMQVDFEPILERQIHHLINGAEGIWHMGQRDIMWTRVSKQGFANGIRLADYGRILHAKLLSEYSAIVDKVKVTLITDEAEVNNRIGTARKTYDERNRRLESMTDDSVDTFYSCLLCQSFAPDHVCIITPERLGLCGAYNWLDGKAAYEIDETGPNQPVKKGRCIDPQRGIWKGIDEYVYTNSHKVVDSFSAYSIMFNPMTSCGCFEAICAYVPELNGVMVVNREFIGETPVGMTFATLAGNVGGGQQTPGFIGVGKVFLTSKKFLYAEGGFKRLVWMPKELKDILADDLKKRFEEQGVPDLIDKIADETICTEVEEIKNFMTKVDHPALEMEDMAVFAEAITDESDDDASVTEEEVAVSQQEDTIGTAPAGDTKITPELIKILKEQIAREIRDDIKTSVTKEVVNEIIGTLSSQFLGKTINTSSPGTETPQTKKHVIETTIEIGPSAKERIKAISSFKLHTEKCEVPVWEVKLGATREEGGTRGHTLKIGGASCMPFHLWEGKMPNRPLVALEVFDSIGSKYPDVLKNIYGEVMENPAEMAKICVNKYGADLISIRLDGTHPEKGNRPAEESVKLVKSVLEAVDIPIIVTGHNNYGKNNEVLKAVAQACAGENLLLNWVEQDNYRTIAGAAMAYGHTIVAQSPIDVNISKQMNILLTNMDIKKEQIVMDPMTGSVGYGIEYTYSVMERIRMTGINGDKMLAGPMIVSSGQECSKVKEFKADKKDFPSWGELSKRASTWELATAVNLLYAGADIIIMYHPDAAMATKRTIKKLMDNKN